MNKAEMMCPGFYRSMPNPADVMAPCDDELMYGMWMPGLQWRPEPKARDGFAADGSERSFGGRQGSRGGSRGDGDAEGTDADMQEAELEVEELDEIKDRFMAAAGGNTMDVNAAAQLARSMGASPSEADIAAMVKKRGDSVDYKSFHDLLAEWTHKDRVDSLAEAFSVWDATGSGFLTQRQVVNILTTFGEQMDATDVEAALTKIGMNNQRIEILPFCTALVG